MAEHNIEQAETAEHYGDTEFDNSTVKGLKFPTILIANCLGIAVATVMSWKTNKTRVPEDMVEKLGALTEEEILGDSPKKKGYHDPKYPKYFLYICESGLVVDSKISPLPEGPLNLSKEYGLDESQLEEIDVTAEVVKVVWNMSRTDFIPHAYSAIGPTFWATPRDPNAKSFCLGAIVTNLTARVAPKYTSTAKQLVVSLLRDIISNAGEENLVSATDLVSANELKGLIIEEFNKECATYFNEIINQNKGRISTAHDGEAYEGLLINHKRIIGTAFRKMPKEKNIWYTSASFKKEVLKKSELEKEGLSGLIPPAKDGEGNTDVVHWLMPKKDSLIAKVQKKYPGLETCMYQTFLEESVLSCLSQLRNKAATEMDDFSGITYLEDPSDFTPAKISKSLYTAFESSPLPTPFRLWNCAILGNSKAFWASLYSALIPTKNPRKACLFVGGHGGAFKSQFIDKVMGEALRGTLFSNKVFERGSKDSVVYSKASSRDSSASTASVFTSARHVQYGVIQYWEEMHYFSPTSRDNNKLKVELGTNTMQCEEKGHMPVQVPCSRTHIVDSNMPPHEAHVAPDKIARITETWVVSPSKMYPKANPPEYYFENNLSKKELDECKAIYGDTKIDTLRYQYLPFLFFRAVMGYGKKCYEELKQDTSANEFTPLDYRKFDKKSLATCYLTSERTIAFKERYQGSNDTVDPRTIGPAVLCLMLAPQDGSEVSYATLKQYLKKVLPSLEGDSNKKYKENAYYSEIENCLNNLQAFMGKDVGNMYYEDGIVHNCALDFSIVQLESLETHAENARGVNLKGTTSNAKRWTRSQYTDNLVSEGFAKFVMKTNEQPEGDLI